jgi:2-haloacid dehalogenase
MSLTIAFDIYGTLIDTDGVVVALRNMVGDKAEAFSRTWRNKQVEYAFRRGLMQRYEPFSVCVRDALEYCCLYYQQQLTAAQKATLLKVYRELPAFQDVGPGLSRLKADKHQLYAFSNGSADAVEMLLNKAGIRSFFQGIVSTEGIKSFKPNPAVYHYFLQQADAAYENAWLVSSNPFDVMGAVSAGMKAAWLQRNPSDIFDPWDMQPTLTIERIEALADITPG